MYKLMWLTPGNCTMPRRTIKFLPPDLLKDPEDGLLKNFMNKSKRCLIVAIRLESSQENAGGLPTGGRSSLALGFFTT